MVNKEVGPVVPSANEHMLETEGAVASEGVFTDTADPAAAAEESNTHQRTLERF